MAVAEVNLGEVARSREVIDHLADRRPEAYGAPAPATALELAR
jgi:hypothetical protein